MLRPFLYSIAGLLALVLLGYFTVAAPIADARFNKTADASSPPPSARAQALHDSLLVADLHNDLLLWARDPLERHDYGHTDVPRLREGGMGVQVFAAVTQAPSGRSYAGTAGDSDQLPYLVAAQRWPVRTWTSRLERALYQAQKLRRAVARDDYLTLLRTRADLDRTVSRRRDAPATMGTLLAIEGLHALEGTAAHVDTLVDAGYRMMSLTHLHDNALGGSSTGLQKGGLTTFGERVLRRLTARNVIVDLAHASAPLLEAVLDRTEAPVVVSHTGVRATCDSPRNVSDRQIRRVAAQDGVIGIGLWEGAVCGKTPAATARAMRHVADLVGVEHVALGSDFDGTVTVPFDAAGLPRLTDALLDAGFSPDEIEQIMGGNVTRLLRRTLPAADA
jgi:microsomal dipeptidase-like Zn-dependent dipeptidase